MIMNDQTILTPYDDDGNYHPDWRRRIGLIAASAPRGVIPVFLLNDDYIRKYTHFMRCNASQFKENQSKSRVVFIPDPARRDLQMVQNWWDASGSPFRYYIETMLLLDVDMEFIASTLGTTLERIKWYEKLFFNIRDNKGKVKSSRALRMRFAVNSEQDGVPKSEHDEFTEWRVTAVEYGVSGLAKYWHWKIVDTHPLDSYDTMAEASEALLISRIAKGQISNRDLNELQSNFIARKRLELDRDLAGKSPEQLAEKSGAYLNSVEMKFLQLLAPEMHSTADSDEELNLKKAAIERKLSVQKAIEDTRIIDKGPSLAVASLSEALKSQV